MSYPDIPVVCLESGCVMLLEKIITGGGEVVLESVVRHVYEDGAKAEIQGIPCPACRFQDSVLGVESSFKKFCLYRPLRGPLYVPR